MLSSVLVCLYDPWLPILTLVLVLCLWQKAPHPFFKVMDFLLLSFRLLACQSNSILTSKDRHTLVIFFYVGFLSPIFPIHRTAGEGGGYLFNFSLPLPPASETLRHISRAITADSSPLHVASSRTRTGNFWFPSASRQPLSNTKLSCL